LQKIGRFYLVPFKGIHLKLFLLLKTVKRLCIVDIFNKNQKPCHYIINNCNM
jgi:hypothetical protein